MREGETRVSTVSRGDYIRSQPTAMFNVGVPTKKLTRIARSANTLLACGRIRQRRTPPTTEPNDTALKTLGENCGEIFRPRQVGGAAVACELLVLVSGHLRWLDSRWLDLSHEISVTSVVFLLWLAGPLSEAAIGKDSSSPREEQRQRCVFQKDNQAEQAQERGMACE